MNVILPSELQKYVKAKLSQGTYTDASEVMREALRSLQREEQSREAGTAALRRDLAEAAAQLDRGEGRPFDPKATKKRIRSRVAQFRAAEARRGMSAASNPRKKSA
jgi:antitoxin ParD1/3/4